jgi:hypothetical protein
VSTALIVADTAERRLAEISTVAEAKYVRDELETLRAHVKRVREGLATQNRVAFAKVLVERRGGELLSQLEHSSGGRTPASAAGVSAPSAYREALTEAGLAERTAERWQSLAVWLGEGEIRKHYAECCEASEEFTSSGVYWLVSWAKYEAEKRERFDRWLRGEGPASGTARQWPTSPPRLRFSSIVPPRPRTVLDWGSVARKRRFWALVHALGCAGEPESLILALLEAAVARRQEPPSNA